MLLVKDHYTMNWAMTRKKKDSRLSNDFYSLPGFYSPKIGLHKNCKGCPHIIEENQCKYVRTPKVRKWPCFFRDHVKYSKGG